MIQPLCVHAEHNGAYLVAAALEQQVTQSIPRNPRAEVVEATAAREDRLKWQPRRNRDFGHHKPVRPASPEVPWGPADKRRLSPVHRLNSHFRGNDEAVEQVCVPVAAPTMRVFRPTFAQGTTCRPPPV